MKNWKAAFANWMLKAGNPPRTGGAPPYVKPKVTADDREKANNQFHEDIKVQVDYNTEAAEVYKARMAEKQARRAAKAAQQNPTTENPQQ